MNATLRTDRGFAFYAGTLIALLCLFLLWSFREQIPFSGAVLSLGAFTFLLIVPAATRLTLLLASRLPQGGFPFYRFAKYGVIGALNTVLNFSIFNALMLVSGISQGLLVNLFSVITYVLTITHSFLWNKFVIFQNEERGAGGQYARFFLVSGSTGLLVVAMIHILVNVVGAPAYIEPRLWANIAVAFTIPVSVLGNFLGYSLFVFAAKKSEQTKIP